MAARSHHSDCLLLGIVGLELPAQDGAACLHDLQRPRDLVPQQIGQDRGRSGSLKPLDQASLLRQPHPTFADPPIRGRDLAAQIALVQHARCPMQ